MNKIAHLTAFCSGRYTHTVPLAAKQQSERFSFKLKICERRVLIYSKQNVSKMSMKLNIEQISKITHGAERIVSDNDGIKFYRFNEQEENVYKENKIILFEKLFYTSGIEMEFITDSTLLKITTEVSGTTNRKYFAFDIYADDVLVGCLGNVEDMSLTQNYQTEEYPLGIFNGSFSLGEGKKTVRIVFPFSVIAVIKELILENVNFVEPVRKNKTLVAYGDSITQGYDALHPSNTYISGVAQALDAELFNKGIGGDIFFPPLALTERTLSPDYVFVSYGGNDRHKVTKDEFEINCAKFIDGIAEKYPESEIYVISPIWAKRYELNEGFADIADIGRIIERICKRNGKPTFISGLEAVPHNEKYFADVYTHPNDIGYGYYLDYLKNVMKTKERNKND